MNTLTKKMPSVWLALAAACGFMWALPYAVGFLTGEMLPWNGARWAYAGYGALVYGWALTVFRMPKPCELLRHICVTVGMLTIVMGEGSGLLLMPFALWVSPVMGGLLVCAAVASFNGLRRDELLVELTAPCSLAAALLSLWWGGGLGTHSLLDNAALESCICGVPLIYLLWKNMTAPLTVARRRMVNLVTALVMLMFPVCGGIAGLKGFPISVDMVLFGTVFQSIATLLAVGLLCMIKVKVGFKVLAAVPLIVLFWPFLSDSVSFSLVEWYLPAMVMLACAGLRHRALGNFWAAGDKALMAGAVVLVLICLLGVLAAVDMKAFPDEDRARIMCGWVGVCSCLMIPAMLLTATGAVLNWRQYVKNETAFSGKGGIWGVVMVGLLLLTALVIYLHSPLPSPLEVKRPATDARGAEIFAAEGCAMCHTQMIRRTPSMEELQMVVNRAENPDFTYRATEPEDIDAAGNREGAAHVGRAAVGPNLSNAVEFITFGRLMYEDAVTGRMKRAAQAREWLALHLYHPQEKQFNAPWSFCPAMTGLFECRKIRGAVPSADALPVQTAPGYEVVPTERGRHLLNYLCSLYRAELTPIKGREHLERNVSHLPPGGDAPVNTARLKQKAAAQVMEKGRDIYMNKCSICHGKDGRGDKVTYPPLAGSNWLKEKSDAELKDIILNGLTGPIEVNGQQWNSTMLPPGVTDERDLQRLIIFLRSHFGE